jgi:hypothetical protein
MQQWEMGLSNGMGNVVYRELIPDDATVTYSFRLSEFGVVPIDVFTPFFPFIPNVPEFTIPNLNGDISGQFGVNNANPSLIVQKPELTIGSLKSSEIVINAVEDSLDISELSKTTPKALFNAWEVKATPIATDKLVIIDSADSDELKVVTGVPLTMLGQGGATDGQAIVWNDADGKWEAGDVDGSKWTEVANGIYRDGRVAINATAVGTNGKLQVFQTGSETGLRIETNQNTSGRAPFQVFRGSTLLHEIDSNSAVRYNINTGTDLGQITFGAPNGKTGFAFLNLATSATKRFDYRNDWVNGWVEIMLNTASSANPNGDSFIGLQISEANGIRTGNFSGSTSRFFKIGERKTATVLLDTTGYITLHLNGVTYNLATVTPT